MSLFRKEVFDAKNQKLHGNIVLSQPLSLQFTIISFLVIVTILIIFSLSFTYREKVTLSGEIGYKNGEHKITLSNRGRVDKVNVFVGETVSKGDLLFSLSDPTLLASGDSFSYESSKNTNLKIETLQLELNVYKEKKSIEKKTRKTSNTLTQKEIDNINNQIQLLDQRNIIIAEQYNDIKTLFMKKIATKNTLQSKKNELLKVRNEINSYAANLIAKQKEINENESAINNIDYDVMTRGSQISQQILDLMDKINKLSLEQNQEVKAKNDGVITSLRIKEGDILSPTDVIGYIQPKGGKLVAIIDIPSSAVGKIQIGQQVKIRVSTFDYQRFGMLDGTVEELEVSGIKDRNDNFFRSFIKLNKTSLSEGNDRYNIKGGMSIEVDFITGEKTILEWVLEPVLQIESKLN